MSLEPGQTLSHYRLLEQIGQGGMGVVWKALDTSLGREVALKLLPDELGQDAERLARLEGEARALAALNHPNIVTIHSIEEAEGRRFLAMELLPGRPLAELIPSDGFPVHELLRIARPVVEAVGAAHRRGVTHRDLKPRNVMVAEDSVKVLDFGLAQSPSVAPAAEVSEQPTRTLAGERLVGTLAYMAPERIEGLPADARSDIFSLGVLLYEMATGRRPFDAGSAAALISSVLRDAPVPPTRLNPAYPPRLDRIVARCLEKDPHYRWPSAQDLLWELEQMAGEVGAELRLERSIAVLPFADLSREKDQDYFCEGIAEEILIALSGVGGLQVASRSSSFRFGKAEVDVREIGARLGVGALLHGSVRRAGDRLRITAELADTRSGFRIWAERYDREMRDVFAIQDEIAQSIARALEVSLPAGERAGRGAPSPPDVQAYDYYLRGRKFFYLYSRRGMQFALELYSRAIERDASYARAYAGIAQCCAFLYQNAGGHAEDLGRADEAARRALALDPESAEAHAACGVALSLHGEHAQAGAEFETAIHSDPNLFEAHYFYARDCFARGDDEGAVRHYEAAMRARPDDFQSPLLAAQSYARLGRQAQADEARRRGVRLAEAHLRLNPDDARALYMGANGQVALGQLERGLEWADRALAIDPDEAMLLYNIACIRSLAGAKELALDCLERSVRAGLVLRDWLLHDPDLGPLRGEPRFEAVLRSLAQTADQAPASSG
jgi:serine/threonine protein kinase/Tfp pilus assembly protein PilF